MSKNYRWLWVTVALVSGGWLLISLLGVLLMGVLPLIPSMGMTSADTLVFLGIFLVNSGLSLTLLAASWRAVRQHPARVLFPHWGWLILLVLLTLGLLILGGVAHDALATTLWFAPIQMAVIVLPALGLLLMLIWLSGKDHAVTGREVALTLSGGALSTLIALPVEVVGLVASIFVVAISAMLFPGGQEEIMRLVTEVELWQELPAGAVSMEMLAPWLGSPVVLAVLALTIAVVTPIIEEVAKTLVISVLSWRNRPSPVQGFLWGALCGLGFAMVEGIGNGGMGIGEALPWMSGIGSRVLATAMHALVSGLIGLGWSLFWQRRYWALPVSHLAAILFHGLWNFSVVIMLGGAGPMMVGALPTLAGTLLMLTGLALLGSLALLAPVLLLGLPLLLRMNTAAKTPLGDPTSQ